MAEDPISPVPEISGHDSQLPLNGAAEDTSHHAPQSQPIGEQGAGVVPEVQQEGYGPPGPEPAPPLQIPLDILATNSSGGYSR